MAEDAVALSVDLVARARQGEAEAFTAIYDHFSRPLHGYAARLLGNAAWADDVVQDTFVQAWRSLPQLRDDERLEGWLYRIATRKCFSLLRRRRLLSFLPLDLVVLRDQGRDPEERVAEQDLVARALAGLPPGLAACLLLRHGQGFSPAEIAAILDLTPQAVWTRLSRGREAFLAAYERQAKGGRR